jgi:hypothetical protein
LYKFTERIVFIENRMFNITRLWGNIHVISMNCACRLNVRKYTFVVRIVEIWNSLPESVIQAKTVKKFEIGLDEHWKHQECKYDFMANINIRSNSGSDIKSRINDVDLEADIVATSQRPL